MRRFLVSAFLCLLAPPISPGQVDAPKEIRNQSVQGKVVDAKTGLPIRKVNVALLARGGQTEGRYSATTTEDGAFAIQGLKPGRYSVSLEHTGYVPTRRQGSFSLQSGQNLNGLVFKLQPAAVISGKIVDMEGDPMASVSVQATLSDTSANGRASSRGESVSTNDLGEYRISNLGPGKYLISAFPPQRASSARNAGGNGKSNERFIYAATYYPGTINKSQAVPVEVHAGEELSANFGVLMTQAYRVSGTIVGVPSGERLMLLTLEEKGGGTGVDNGPQQLKEGNAFEIDNVLPGTYVARMAVIKGMFGEQPEQQMLRLNPSIEVTDGDVEGVQLQAELPGQVRGMFRLDTGGKLDWTHVVVILFPTADTASSMAIMPRPLNSDGSFEIKNVPSGSYQLLVAARSDRLADCYTKSVMLSGRDVTDSGFEINGDASLDVLVGARGAALEGNVMDDKGQPLVYGTVAVVPNLDHPARFDSYQRPQTDEHGHFIARGLPPGSYSVFAFEDLQEDIRQPEFLRTYKGKGEKVELAEGARKTVTLKVFPVETVGQ